MKTNDCILIQESISSSGRTRVVHVIVNATPSSRSWSSYIMMKEDLRSMDEEEMGEKAELYRYLSMRYRFLIRRLKRRGELRCDYCGRPGLIIGHNRKSNNRISNLATIDHVVPVSKGIDRLDEKNWGVACRKCNGKKGSRPAEEFVEEKKNEREKNEKIKSNETKRFKGRMGSPFQGRKKGNDHRVIIKRVIAGIADSGFVRDSAVLWMEAPGRINDAVVVK
jgi:5-methylcytosine-specific restriction endonuclease McrA